MEKLRIHTEPIKEEDYAYFVLGGDIGGTHTNLAVAGVRERKPVLLYSMHFESPELSSLTVAIEETLAYARQNYGIRIDKGCFGVAGPVSNCSSSQFTNVPLEVDAGRISAETGLGEVFLINDFQALGYGINFLKPEDVVRVKPGTARPRETRALIGAGTGLGKSILVHDEDRGYIPIPSEGGQGDFPVQNRFELELVEFIREYQGIERVSYEEMLAGRGIEHIYWFLKASGKFKESVYTAEIDRATDRAPLISKYRERDGLCREVFRLYAGFYGRCCKNFVLDSLATGGLYIAGGIASNNPDIFTTDEFITEFQAVEMPEQRKILEAVPVYVIINYDVSLYGACYAAMVGKEYVCY